MNPLDAISQFLIQYFPELIICVLFIALLVNAYASSYFVRRVKEYECEIERLNKIADANTKDYQQKIDALQVDHQKQLEARNRWCDDEKDILGRDLHRLNQENLVLFDHNTALADRVIRMTQYVSDLDREVVAGYRAKWLDYVAETTFGSVEVQAYKLAMPLVLFLGYDLDSIRVTVPRRIIGEPPQGKTWDWIISGIRKNQSRRDLFLLELVQSEEKLTDGFLEESAMVASAAHVFKYVVTNGHEFHLRTRNTPYDTSVVACSVSDLAENWAAIESALSHENLAP
ncbi:MAG: hypothetical protein M9936_25995 [Caldilinea sp.]|nr:hypothetical protein [Caldilineaceae bacterium]MCB0256981.1 hypothetical protein [Anaerolineae bacterium]MCO5213167.1 hypothetical protein [Caldilinea sp.]MCB9117093.1 hypothetical protein [Caldilineaceae bacterium]MCB9118816.1 hypothetical protein [Caldilineaceae bacterium]